LRLSNYTNVDRHNLTQSSKNAFSSQRSPSFLRDIDELRKVNQTMLTFNTGTNSDFMKSQLAQQNIGFLIGSNGKRNSKMDRRSSNRFESEAFNTKYSQMFQTDYTKKFLATGQMLPTIK